MLRVDVNNATQLDVSGVDELFRANTSVDGLFRATGNTTVHPKHNGFTQGINEPVDQGAQPDRPRDDPNSGTGIGGDSTSNTPNCSLAWKHIHHCCAAG